MNRSISLTALILASCSSSRVQPAGVPAPIPSLDARGTSGASLSASSHADTRFELGLTTGAWLGDGEPANDIPIPIGLYGRYRLSDDWWLRLGLEYAEGDFETPQKLLGLEQDPDQPDIDASATYATALAWIERVWVLQEVNELFVQAGGGLSAVEVDDVQGPLLGGGSFDIETDAGTEWIGSVGAGYRRHFGNWRAELRARWDFHAADWELADGPSGATGSVDDYATWAFLAGIGYSF